MPTLHIFAHVAYGTPRPVALGTHSPPGAQRNNLSGSIPQPSSHSAFVTPSRPASAGTQLTLPPLCRHRYSGSGSAQAAAVDQESTGWLPVLPGQA